MNPDDPAWLSENDCFGTRTPVVVKKVHSGGNAKVIDLCTGKLRECATANLSPRQPHHSLPHRIQPNVDAVPWVIAEIKKREEAIAALIEELTHHKAENAKLRDALQTILRGGYAPGADVAHPAIALARDTLDPKWRERASSHYPKDEAGFTSNPNDSMKDATLSPRRFVTLEYATPGSDYWVKQSEHDDTKSAARMRKQICADAQEKAARTRWRIVEWTGKVTSVLPANQA